MSITAPGRFRSLSTMDRKQISHLRSLIDEIGKEVALRSNNLDVVFSNLRSLAKEIPAAESEGIFSVTSSDIASLQALINCQEKLFRDDEMDIYHFELDEDLLLPIAHECVALWNRIEGFSTAAFVPPSEEMRSKKKARIEQTKAKKELAAEKLRDDKQEKERLREADRLKKEELKKSLLSPFHEVATIDDALIVNPRPLGFVDYSSIPLNDPKEFSRALEIWTFLVSIPQVLTLSQFSLSLFISSIEDDRETFLIQEICKMLVQVGAKGSPLVKMPVKTAGRNWFDQVREYLAVASGAKQRRKEEQEQRRVLAAKKKEEEGGEDDANGASDEEKEDRDQDGNEEEEDIDFATDFADMMAAMEELKNRVGWGNLQIHDRLVLLKFLVDSILQAKKVVADADNVTANDAAEQATFERAVKDQREEFEKELKLAMRKKLEGDETISGTREAAIQRMKAGIEKAFAKRLDGLENRDVGARILPLGEDRFGRIYWRFPKDENIFVQAIGSTKQFPILSKPKAVFLDDEEDFKGDTSSISPAATQLIWGKIIPADLSPFISSLDSRGTKESALKSELERLEPHLTSFSNSSNMIRSVRTRAAASKGYNNRLNIPAMLPY